MTSILSSVPPRFGSNQCSEGRTYLRADLHQGGSRYPRVHTLTVCSDGEAKAAFAVAAGANGIGKTKWGDGRTPAGSMQLSKPRPSGSGFDTFIQFDWKDRVGRSAEAAGATPLGIHGPLARRDGMGADGDWTQGCLSTATRADIKALAALVIRYSIRELEVNVISETAPKPRAQGHADGGES